MKYARVLVALPALFCLACPGDWDEPLGPVRGGHIDEKLVGDWRCQETDGGGKPFRLTIVPFDKHQYVFVSIDPDKREPPGAVRAFTTTVSGHDVMNIQILDDKVRDGWNYARLWFREDGRLAIDPIRKEPLQDVPDDVESRRLAIGDLFAAPELWEDGFGCVPFKDQETPAK
jgi:hypothetical protein